MRIEVPKEQPNALFDHVYAIIRFDEPADPSNWHDAVSIVKIFRRRPEAEAETNRLSSMNDSSKCVYRVVIVRADSSVFK